MRSKFALKPVSVIAGSNSGADLRFDTVPAQVGDKENYIEGLRLRVKGTVHVTTGDASDPVLAEGEIASILKGVTLQIPNLPKALMQGARGLDLYRLYKLGNRGRGEIGAVTLVHNTNTAIDFTLKIPFVNKFGRKTKDSAIPARLLKDATFNVQYEGTTNVHARIDAWTLMLTTGVQCHGRAEVIVPALFTFEAKDYVAGETQPTIPKTDDDVQLGMLAKQRTAGAANTGLATTDVNTLGVTEGDKQISQDSQDVADFYGEFAESVAPGGTAFTDHTLAGGAISEGVPLEFPPAGLNGQHVVSDIADANVPWRLKMDVMAPAYTLLTRKVWQPGSWQDVCRVKLGIAPTAQFKQATGSKKPLPVAAGRGMALPLKQTTKG